MITRVEGFLVGHAHDFDKVTGCTVILCPPGTMGSADVRGSAAGTRQMDALVGLHVVEEIQGLCIAGGSAFGLDAAGGVMAFLEEQGRGFDVGLTRVPIVPTAVIYDLSVGDWRALAARSGMARHRTCLPRTPTPGWPSASSGGGWLPCPA